MNRFALQLLAATAAAAFALSSAQASSTAEWLGEDASFNAATDTTPSYVAFEENFPASDGPDIALTLDLTSEYVSEITFSPIPDFGVDAPPLLVASLDPMETP